MPAPPEPLPANEVPQWRLTGDWWDLCNCAIGCPCNFGSNPTLGYCEGVLTWLIRGGHYGNVEFQAGLAVVLIIHWEGNVMDKNREFGFLIDARADDKQREALRNIFTGRAGGAFAAWRDLTLSLDGVEFVDMKVTHDAENWRVEVPGTIIAAIITLHMRNSSAASSGVQDGAMPFIDMAMSRHIAASIASIWRA
jgi:hypothetical protein